MQYLPILRIAITRFSSARTYIYGEYIFTAQAFVTLDRARGECANNETPKTHKKQINFLDVEREERVLKNFSPVLRFMRHMGAHIRT